MVTDPLVHVVPPTLRGALAVLDAPEGMGSVDEAVAWALENLTFPLTCGVEPGASTTKGSVRHRVRVDPLTGQTGPAPVTDAEAKRVETSHFLWALAQPTPTACVEAGQVLTDWVGVMNPDRVAPWPKTRVGEMLAVRTVMRAVTYTVEGFAPVEYARWLRIGATAGNLRNLHAVLDDYGLDLARVEGRVLSGVNRRIGGPGRPYAGDGLFPRSRDIDEAVAAWCAVHAEKARAPWVSAPGRAAARRR